jgi:hypothetical protein
LGDAGTACAAVLAPRQTATAPASDKDRRDLVIESPYLFAFGRRTTKTNDLLPTGQPILAAWYMVTNGIESTDAAKPPKVKQARSIGARPIGHLPPGRSRLCDKPAGLELSASVVSQLPLFPARPQLTSIPGQAV